MQLQEVMAELKALGNKQTVKIYRNHGANGDMYGVKIGDMKKVLRKVKGDQDLAMQLWDTNNSDAMYMAGLLADGSKMTKTQLNHWAKTAWWDMLSECSVPGVASENDDPVSLAKKWMKSKKENVAACGWCTYAAVLSIRPDDELDLAEIKSLLKQVEAEVHDAPNRVRLCMNSFVICVGTYIKPLLRNAKASAKRIGKVDADMGNTSCKIPLATDYIDKVDSMGRVGKKRKTAKC
ncbi:MAG: DNA alkylation repair protein [Planctomycetales bacterium]|nr:DNA alkylation repair protein [Planctomycetales bacterium]